MNKMFPGPTVPFPDYNSKPKRRFWRKKRKMLQVDEEFDPLHCCAMCGEPFGAEEEFCLKCGYEIHRFKE